MITYIIIGITVVISFLCFQNQQLMSKLRFNPALVTHKKEYYRMFSYAFVHADFTHLFVNMLVLYFFGPVVERFFSFTFGSLSTVYFLGLYIGGILIANLWSLQKHKNNYGYNAVGASGAVSALLFTFIFFAPWEILFRESCSVWAIYCILTK